MYSNKNNLPPIDTSHYELMHEFEHPKKRCPMTIEEQYELISLINEYKFTRFKFICDLGICSIYDPLDKKEERPYTIWIKKLELTTVGLFGNFNNLRDIFEFLKTRIDSKKIN